LTRLRMGLHSRMSPEIHLGTKGGGAGSDGGGEGPSVILHPPGDGGEVVGPGGRRRGRWQRGPGAAGGGAAATTGSPRLCPLRHGPHGQVAMSQKHPFGETHTKSAGVEVHL
jgi:hypothetical protein